jgi:hypothetical protein
MYGEGASIRMKPGDAVPWPLGNGCRLVCKRLGQYLNSEIPEAMLAGVAKPYPAFYGSRFSRFFGRARQASRQAP